MKRRDRIGDRFALPRPFRRAGALVLRRPLALALIVIPLALALGSLAGYAVARAGTAQSPYRLMRLQAAADQLARIEGDYLLAAGDSHIERWPARRLCGLPVVNAGVSGATAGSYAGFLADLFLPRPPRAVLLTIGTNDAQSRRLRGAGETGSRFAADLNHLLAMLAPPGRLVVLTGPPPLDPERAIGFSTAAAAGIAAAGAAVCVARPGCINAGPFPRGLTMNDGVHFDDYETAYQGLEAALCARLGTLPSRRHDIGADAP